MIFKTYETDIDGISNKLGFSKRTFAEWGKQVKKSFDEAGGGLKGFANALSTAFTVQNSDKDFIKYNGQIVTKNNINSYIPELVPNRADELTTEINAVVKAKGSWNEYYTTLNNGEEYIIDFIKNTEDLSKITGEDLIKANQAARQSAIDHNAALQKQTAGAKAAAAATGLLKTALNSIAFMAIMQAIMALANTIITKIDDIVNAYQKGIDRLKDLSSEIKGLESKQS